MPTASEEDPMSESAEDEDKRCSYHACPDCRRNEHDVEIDRRRVPPERLREIEQEWLDRGIIQ